MKLIPVIRWMCKLQVIIYCYFYSRSFFSLTPIHFGVKINAVVIFKGEPDEKTHLKRNYLHDWYIPYRNITIYGV